MPSWLRVTTVVGGLLLAAGSASAQIVRVSVATDGTVADGPSLDPAMSSTGRFVAFVSFATNLVPGDTNGLEDVFLRDRDTDADGVFDEAGAVSTVRVSERPGIQANGPSHVPAITPDGRYVVFQSFASSLFSTGQPPLAVSVVLRWDRLTGDIVLVSQTDAGEPLLAVRSVDADVSNDGNQVVFTYGGSTASESISGFRGVIYRRDIAAGTLTQVSTVQLNSGVEFKEHNVSPSISGDGATIAYGIENKSDLHGKIGGTAYIVDAASNAIRASHQGLQPRLSKDGAFLDVITALGENAGGTAVRIHLASSERRSTGFFGINSSRVSASPSARYYMIDNLLVDFDHGSFVLSKADLVAFDAADTMMAYAERQFTPGRELLDVLVGTFSTLLDNDADGLNDHWETTFGLDTGTAGGATGDNGAAGDPDADGLTNRQELAGGSHPAGTLARFLAEGATGSFFATRVAIANPTSTQANVAVRFNLDGGGTLARSVWVRPRERVTFDSRALGIGTVSFSTVVESTVTVAVDRLMTWGDAQGQYGSHAETASASPGTSWFLAEGSTVLGFQLFYLLQNPGEAATTATVRFLLPAGAPIVRTYDLPARSRTTIYVNTVPGLEATDVSAEVTATNPIAVERAMYRNTGAQVFALGHDAAAVAVPGTTWLFAEGVSNDFFDTYLLLANFTSTDASVEVSYLVDAPITRTYTVPANSRFSIFVDDVGALGFTSYGMKIVSTVPVVAERAVYWANGFFNYYEGHVSAGATTPGSHWVLAECELLSTLSGVSFVLIANTGTAPATVVVNTLPEPGGVSRTTGAFTILPGSRQTLPLSILADGGTRFGVEVVEQGTSTGALIVEASLYSSLAGQVFATGANWPATRIP